MFTSSFAPFRPPLTASVKNNHISPNIVGISEILNLWPPESCALYSLVPGIHSVNDFARMKFRNVEGPNCNSEFIHILMNEP